jgi:hypothetical protein
MHPRIVLGFLAALPVISLASAAPSLLWGDDAELQRIAVTGEARAIGQSSAASHLLWQIVASAFVRWTAWLPLDEAGRVTLVSAIAAALVIIPLALTVRDISRQVGLGNRAAAVGSVVGAVALGLSHTFWLLASRPDAYTIQTFLLASALWAAVRASGSASPWRWWLVVVGIVAVTMTNHAMVLASLPGLGVVAISGRIERRAVLVAGGLAIAIGVVVIGAAREAGFPFGALAATLTRYRPQLPRPLDPIAWLVYLAYQFPVAMMLVRWGFPRFLRSQKRLGAGLLLLFVGPVVLVLFPALYIRDQYIFYLPSYLPVAVVIGLAAGWIVENPPTWVRVRGRWLTAALVAMACAPIAVYPLAAAVAGPIATRLAPSRVLPGRDPVWYYLWPPKTGYTGARDYVTAAFSALPQGAVVVADWLPYQPMRYVQAVEGGRPDVRLEMINAGDGRQMAFLRAQPPGATLFLADVSPAPYYEIDDIRACFDIEAVGVVYRLRRKEGC